MKNWGALLLTLIAWTVFSVGCATVGKNEKVKCPKCGAIFTVDESLEGVRVGLPKP